MDESKILMVKNSINTSASITIQLHNNITLNTITITTT